MVTTVYHPGLDRTMQVRTVTNGLLRAGWVVQDDAHESAQVRQEDAPEAGQSDEQGDHLGPDDSEGAVSDA